MTAPDPNPMTTAFVEAEWRRSVQFTSDVISRLDDRPLTEDDRVTLACALVLIGSAREWREALIAADRSLSKTATDGPSDDLFWRSIDITTAELRLVLEAYLSHQTPSDADRRSLAPFLAQLGTYEQLLDAVRVHDEYWTRRARMESETSSLDPSS